MLFVIKSFLVKHFISTLFFVFVWQYYTHWFFFQIHSKMTSNLQYWQNVYKCTFICMRRNEVKTKRLDNLLCNIVFFFSVMAFCVFFLRILITGFYEFYHAVNVRKTHVEENKWLLVECTKPEFYANLKKHSQICDDVNLEKHDSIYLHALKDVMENLSLSA